MGAPRLIRAENRGVNAIIAGALLVILHHLFHHPSYHCLRRCQTSSRVPAQPNDEKTDNNDRQRI